MHPLSHHAGLSVYRSNYRPLNQRRQPDRVSVRQSHRARTSQLVARIPVRLAGFYLIYAGLCFIHSHPCNTLHNLPNSIHHITVSYETSKNTRAHTHFAYHLVNRKATRPKGAENMPPPGLQIYLRPYVTSTFDLLTPTLIL